MQPPFKGFKLSKYPDGSCTQWFGENPSLYAPMGLMGHNGQDHVAPHGEEMYAVEDGEVLSVKDDPAGYGKNVRFISSKKNSNGYYNLWTYGHNSKNLVQQGDKITAGQPIALMGNTGFVVSGNTPFWKSNPYAGTHLHIGLREVTKGSGWSYPGSKTKLEIVNYENGFKGSVDPYPFLADLSRDQAKHRATQLTVISLLNTLLGLLKLRK